MSRLQEIQVMTQQMAEAIFSVLGMDVTIVDETMARIAGTGRYNQSIGQKIIGNSVFHKVIKNVEEYIITDVSTHTDCNRCEQHDSCMELAQLCCPIILGKEAIGVVGLIAFSEEQQLELRDKHKQLLVFIRKMAELISAKAAEKGSLNRIILLKNQIESVLNFVVEGILAIDSDAQVININYAAEKMLNVKGNDVIGFHINEIFPATPIPEVLRTGRGFVNREVSIWHKGKHHHYLINAKPILIDGIGIVQGVVASFQDVNSYKDNSSVVYKSQVSVSFDQIIGTSRAIEHVKEEARQAATSSSTVIIMGESGTGKEIFAQAIHSASECWREPFIAINCAAIPENLLESEMFGYEEGSFSGAKKGGKPGKFQLANKGTLFLDEIGDMPLSLQAKMLRVLQDKVVERVGGIQSTKVDVRVIVATNRNLEDMVKAGQFREDLYYRLYVFPILLPSLRERIADIMLLADYFLQKHAVHSGKKIAGFTKEATEALQQYSWPGNVRELENAIECTLLKMSGTVIELEDLPVRISNRCYASKVIPIVDSADKIAIKVALETYGYDVQGKKQAAASMGIGIATLYRKINKYKL